MYVCIERHAHAQAYAICMYISNNAQNSQKGRYRRGGGVAYIYIYICIYIYIYILQKQDTHLFNSRRHLSDVNTIKKLASSM